MDDMSTTEIPDIIDIHEVSDDDTSDDAASTSSVATVPALVDEVETVVDLPLMPSDNEFRALATQALMLAGSSLVPNALRGKPHDVLLVLMTGRDLGIAPTAALRKCYVVDGQVTIAPALKLALVKIKGLGFIRPGPDNNRDAATAIGYDSSGREIGRQTITFDDVKDITIDKARKVHLVDKDNWRNYRARMLWWRAAGYLVDDLWPEVSFGLYTPDEIGAVTDEEGRVLDIREVPVVTGYEPKTVAPAEMIADALAESLTARAMALPAAAKELLREQKIEREMYGSLFSLTAARAKVMEALIVAIEKRAAAGEWGDWAPSEPSGPSDPVVVDYSPDALAAMTPAALATVPEAALRAALAEWEITATGIDKMDRVELAELFATAAQAPFEGA